MIYIKNDNLDPAINHAIEDYFMENYEDSFFSLWRNWPVILLGKNQDAWAEVNFDSLKDHGLDLVRRRSGGGAIYCDPSNMQYSFISNDDKTLATRESFKAFARPVVQALRDLGLEADFTGRNDILIEGCKVSGNAQYHRGGRVIHHGSLLFDVDKDIISQVLYSRPIKFQNKKVKSVSSRVGAISSYVDMDIEDFMAYMVEKVLDYYHIDRIIDVNNLSQEAKAEIKDLASFYRKEDFIKVYDESYTSFSIKYPYGLVEYKVKEEGGKISDLYILGDYFEDRDVKVLAGALIGQSITREDLERALDGLNVSDYIIGLDEKTLIDDLLTMTS